MIFRTALHGSASQFRDPTVWRDRPQARAASRNPIQTSRHATAGETPDDSPGIEQNVSGSTLASDLYLAFVDIEKRSTDAPLKKRALIPSALGQKKP